MGKASRIKKERRLAMAGTQVPVSTYLQPFSHSIPYKVYRFFKESQHAEALASGMVWLSTLEICRAYEDSYQGDPDEGV